MTETGSFYTLIGVVSWGQGCAQVLLISSSSITFLKSLFVAKKGTTSCFFLVERAGSVRAGDESALVGEEPDHWHNLLGMRVRIRIYKLDEFKFEELSVHLF